MKKINLFIILLFSAQVTIQVHSLPKIMQTVVLNLRKKTFWSHSKRKTIPEEKIYFFVQKKTQELLNNTELVTIFHYITKESCPYAQLFKADSFKPVAQVNTEDLNISIHEKSIKNLPPSDIIHTLLHEYRHIQQIKQLNQKELSTLKSQENFYPIIPVFRSLQKFYNQTVNNKIQNAANPSRAEHNPLWKHNEYDADYFATEQTTCPICLKIIQSRKQISTNSGYFDFDDYIPFIHATNSNNCCPAHTRRLHDEKHNQTLDTLNQRLENIEKIIIANDHLLSEKNSHSSEKELYDNCLKHQELYKQITQLDKESGTLLQHLPNFSKDKINAMLHQQNLWLKILSDEKKRREIKLLPESCASQK